MQHQGWGSVEAAGSGEGAGFEVGWGLGGRI